MGSREVEKLTKRQREILIGKMLGDGFLEMNGKHSRLKIDHTHKQKDYVFWLHNEFLPFTTAKPYKIGYLDERTNKTYLHWRFATKSLPIFNKWRKIFYLRKRKIIPDNIVNLLKSPLTLAVWYMDDGYRRKDCNALYLCTSGYNSDEQLMLQEALVKNFSIQTKVHHAAGNARLYIPARSAKAFCSTISKYIIPSFSYKLL